MGAVTYMDRAHAPDFFEKALKDVKAHFSPMNRPLTVDMEAANSCARIIDERTLHPLRTAISGSNEMNAMFCYCQVNALTQRVRREGGPAT